MTLVLGAGAALLGLAMAYYFALGGFAMAAQLMRHPGSGGVLGTLFYMAPSLLLTAGLLVAGLRAVASIVSNRAAPPRPLGLGLLIAGVPFAAVPLAAFLVHVGVWHDSSIGMWQLLLFPCLPVTLVLALVGWSKLKPQVAQPGRDASTERSP